MAFAIGIDLFRKMKGDKIWDLIKTLGYSAMCAVLALIVLALIVAIF
jgi:hypothetical protein